MIQTPAQPIACEAIRMFWHSAPAESCCSHTGVFLGSCTGEEITARITGARSGRARSAASFSGAASGSRRLRAAANTSPNSARLSPSMTSTRHGSSLRWSGTRIASRRIASMSSAPGPGSLSAATGVERRSAISCSVSGEGWLGASGTPNSGSGGRFALIAISSASRRGRGHGRRQLARPAARARPRQPAPRRRRSSRRASRCLRS